MLKDITSIKLSGANFTSPAKFDYFNPCEGAKVKTVKGALLYGRNGTGKSTTAKAFRKLAGENITTISSALFLDINGNPITLTEEEKKHIFVFDEDFVDRNVRFQQDHLDTIVMLGQAADLTDKIAVAETELKDAKSKFDAQEKLYKEYQDMGNVKSPKYFVIRLSNALRGDDNWAGRDREINNGRQNTGVRDDTFQKFVKLSPDKPKTELISEYKLKIKELKAAREGTSVIATRVPDIEDLYKKYDDEELKQLLSEQIEKPELSEREKKLLLLVQSGKSYILTERLIVFRNQETVECPYCFQTITQEYKEQLAQSIEKVLSKALEDHQYKLQKHIVEDIQLNLTPFEKLDGYNECIECISRLNNALQVNNGLLLEKYNNPYTPIINKAQSIRPLVEALVEALANLAKSRTAFNQAVKKTGPIIKELNAINSAIAHYDIVALAADYEKQKAECAVEEKKYKDLEANLIKKQTELDELEAKRKNIRLALDAINACMQYIFFSADRLKIEYKDGEYKLLSHGKSVKPCEVSVGERNIIGLSYFFTSILEGKSEVDAYKEEYMLVIDDPVSSYDTENKIGILSFLKYKLSIFLEANQNTKTLVMTHDLMTFYDIHKVFEEIITSCKQKGYQNSPKFNRFEMKNGRLEQFTYNSRQEYTEILKTVYKYASGNADDYEIVIGNMMRQLLEAFSTFEYKKGIEDVSTDDKILGLLPGKEYETYYKNLMYRLVLHGGSHKEEQVKTMKDFDFFSLISDIEKKRTAKDILCFIYLLNTRHVLEHLKDTKDSEVTLNTWCKEIQSRAVIL